MNFADFLQSKSATSDEAVSLVNFKIGLYTFPVVQRYGALFIASWWIYVAMWDDIS